jgi:hypothetical protein
VRWSLTATSVLAKDLAIFASVLPSICCINSQRKTSVAWVREQTIPTELPPPVSEVSANVCG